MIVAALYVQKNGCYYGIEGVDPWDEARDARRYDGPHPVVAHPPCSRWCRLAGLLEHRYGLRKGDDGGCFAHALDAVQRWGGVLEHPAYTDAWAAHGIPAPPRGGGWIRTLCGGWTCHVEQGHYGHMARKPTWLYLHGVAKPPVLRWGPARESTACVSLGGRDSWGRRAKREVQQLSKRQRSATPERFRDLLIELARATRAEDRT